MPKMPVERFAFSLKDFCKNETDASVVTGWINLPSKLLKKMSGVRFRKTDSTNLMEIRK